MCTILSLIVVLKVTLAKDIILDYTKANKKTQVYYQVPKNEFIFAKKQAHEPKFFPGTKDRGFGYDEPMLNEMINSLRDSGISIYSDYFTLAKIEFYTNHQDYSICRPSRNNYKHYEDRYINRKTKPYLGKKYFRLSIPYKIYPPIGFLGVFRNKLPAIEKHYYSESKVINIESLINDETLKTVQVNDTGSAIVRFIYSDIYMHTGIKNEYKKRVYIFVASNADQLTYMLNANRMDYVDMTYYGDFYQKKLGFEKKIAFVPFSFFGDPKLFPKLNDKDKIMLDAIFCYGENINELNKIISVINNKIKEFRTNYNFLSKVLMDYSQRFSLPYTPPEQFYDFKVTLELKKKLDQGFF